MIKLTCAFQEMWYKLRKRAEVRKESGHLVEVIEGHGHVFGVPAHIDDLRRDASGRHTGLFH